MGIWSSIHDFYRRWKPEIHLYGIGFLLLVSALITGRTAAAGIVFVLIVIWDIMRRWGEPWRQIGEKELERRHRINQELWRERFDSWFGREKEPPPPPLVSEPTRLIPSPMRDGEEPPESPIPIQEKEKPLAPIPPPVTHDT